MKYFYGDIIKEKLGTDCIICITTNGFIKKNGCAVMGRGIARQIFKFMRPQLNLMYEMGKLLKEVGNIVFPLCDYKGTNILTFPVKPKHAACLESNSSEIVPHLRHKFKSGDFVPGWACAADLDIIKKSAEELKEYLIQHNYKHPVYLPKPGCGAGDRSYSDVKKIIEPILGDLPNLYICDFEKGENDD